MREKLEKEIKDKNKKLQNLTNSQVTNKNNNNNNKKLTM